MNDLPWGPRTYALEDKEFHEFREFQLSEIMRALGIPEDKIDEQQAVAPVWV